MLKRLSILAGAFMLLTLLTIQASAKEITIRGQLARTVEAGGWLIIADTDEQTTKYLLLNSRRFQKEKWFQAGTQVEATGETRPDAMTIYQQGVPFEARNLKPIGRASANRAAGTKEEWKPLLFKNDSGLAFAFHLFPFYFYRWQSTPNLV
jgi:hypothetical protein